MGNCIPFACTLSPRYQQLYLGSLFGTSPLTITGIRLYDPAGPLPGTVISGTYTLRLSTSTRTQTTLSADFDANLGANTATVFDAAVERTTLPTDGFFQFTLGSAFLYDPAAGNLLLDVVSANQVLPFGFLDWRQSTQTVRVTEGVGPSSNGLRTGFVASTVPEPSTWALLGTGLLAVGGIAARRRRG